MQWMQDRNQETKMHKPAVVGVFVLASNLFCSGICPAQEAGGNAEQPVSAEEKAGEASAVGSAIHCESALQFEARDEGGMLKAEVSYDAESFLAAVLISASKESFLYGEDQILIGSLASLGASAESSYVADIDLNGYAGPLWMQVLLLTDDGRLVASDIRPRQAAEQQPSPGPANEIRYQLAVTEGIPATYDFAAEYEANSDGYALELARVENSWDRTDIYLVLVMPGLGGGMLDIVESHAVHANLGSEPGSKIRIYVASRTQDEDGEDLDYQLQEELDT